MLLHLSLRLCRLEAELRQAETKIQHLEHNVRTLEKQRLARELQVPTLSANANCSSEAWT